MIEKVTQLKNYFEKKDLDLRKSKFSRFMDQKVTPDVASFIADCVTNLKDNSEFTAKDILISTYFEKNVTAVFGKPSPKNENTSNEYDKFVNQSLRMLSYSGVLDDKYVGQRYIYSVKERKLLNFLEINERNAFNFLYLYIEKVLSDSGLLSYFEEFRDKCIDKSVEREDFCLLKERFIKFMRGHFPFNQDVEIRRIFPKILNIYAVGNQINGTIKGNLSKHNFYYSDLMYNNVNFRDEDKAKGMSRIEYQQLRKQKQKYYEPRKQKQKYYDYQIEKAKDLIRKKYNESEVRDRYGKGSASHIHHIFPVPLFPQLGAFLENLIKLTATQHLEKAHPKGNTQRINRDYQCVCLIAKSQSVENSIIKKELDYTKVNLIYVVNEGLGLSLDNSTTFRSIRNEITKAYNKV